MFWKGKSSTLDLGECGISTSVGRVGSHGRYLQVKGELVHGGGWEEEVVFLRKRHNSLGGGQNWSFWVGSEDVIDGTLSQFGVSHVFFVVFLKISASWLRKKGMRPSMPLSDMSPEAWEGGIEKLLWDVFACFVLSLWSPPLVLQCPGSLVLWK